MFSFLRNKKAPKIIITCTTNSVTINENKVDFPTNYKRLTDILGSPSRELEKSKCYAIWDSIGFLCAYTDKDYILSIHILQNNKVKSEYNTQKQFTGDLFLNKENITNDEFIKISLGNIAIHRLGSETEIRYGFSIGTNENYKTSR